MGLGTGGGDQSEQSRCVDAESAVWEPACVSQARVCHCVPQRVTPGHVAT